MPQCHNAKAHTKYCREVSQSTGWHWLESGGGGNAMSAERRRVPLFTQHYDRQDFSSSSKHRRNHSLLQITPFVEVDTWLSVISTTISFRPAFSTGTGLILADNKVFSVVLLVLGEILPRLYFVWNPVAWHQVLVLRALPLVRQTTDPVISQIGRASCRERVF